MGKKLPILCAGACLVFLAGCNTSGTTYGTGTTHEEATLESMYNMFSIAPKKRPDIDYSARPDLVMPANQQALPNPDAETTESEENWPVSPEQRIAAIRGGAVEPDERSGNLPVEYLLSEKDGIGTSGNSYLRQLSRERSQDGEAQRSTGTYQVDDKLSKKARERRQQLSYSTGVQRKYLTEPPSEYRKPAATAEAGVTGITPEELAKVQKEARDRRKALDQSAPPTPGQ
ncbi:MAG: hypothetical protein AAF412_06115 [Pseudomonadota bacterium]